MKFKLKSITLLLAIVLASLTLLNSTQTSAELTFKKPNYNLISPAILLLDAESGTVLYERNSEQRRTPASLTKMVTAMCVVDKMNLEKEIKVPAGSFWKKGNIMELKPGEKLKVSQLLEALLVYSANDAALALAISCSGSEEAFIREEMMPKLHRMGCKSTGYSSVNGFTNNIASHYTTAADQARIARIFLKYKGLLKITSKKSTAIDATNKSGRRSLESTNKLLLEGYSGLVGIKTGFMNSSGNCFVASAKRDNLNLIAVVMGHPTGPGVFKEAKELLDFGFANYKSIKPAEKGEILGSVRVPNGEVQKVQVAAAKNINLTVDKQIDKSMIKNRLILPKKLNAPLLKGKAVGRIEILDAGKVVKSEALVLKRNVGKGGIAAILGMSKSVFRFTVLIITAVLAVILIIFIRMRKAKKKKMAARRRRRAEIAGRIRAERDRKRDRGWPY